MIPSAPQVTGAPAWLRTVTQGVTRAIQSGPQLDEYEVAALPPASGAKKLIYVKNASGGAVVAFNDGTNWRRVTDRTILS